MRNTPVCTSSIVPPAKMPRAREMDTKTKTMIQLSESRVVFPPSSPKKISRKRRSKWPLTRGSLASTGPKRSIFSVASFSAENAAAQCRGTTGTKARTVPNIFPTAAAIVTVLSSVTTGKSAGSISKCTF